MIRFTDIFPSLCLGLLVAMVAGNTAFAGGMTLTSGEFSDGDYLVNEQVFAGFGCEGRNVSPSLSWSGAPAGAKSFALTVYDPDAPTGSGWWHWVVVNLPAATTSLPKGAGMADNSTLPEGAFQVRTDFGAPGILDRLAQAEPEILLAVDGYTFAGRRYDVGEKIAEVVAALAGFMG